MAVHRARLARNRDSYDSCRVQVGQTLILHDPCQAWPAHSCTSTTPLALLDAEELLIAVHAYVSGNSAVMSVMSSHGQCR